MIRFNRIAAAAIVLSAIAGYTTGGYAAEVKEITVKRTVYSLDVDAPSLKTAVLAVCGDKSVKLSDKAKAACTSAQFPSVTKGGKFRNSGIGAEFNALVAQRS